MFQDVDLIKEQISCLQVRLNDIEANNQAVADRMNVCLGWFLEIYLT